MVTSKTIRTVQFLGIIFGLLINAVAFAPSATKEEAKLQEFRSLRNRYSARTKEQTDATQPEETQGLPRRLTRTFSPEFNQYLSERRTQYDQMRRATMVAVQDAQVVPVQSSGQETQPVAPEVRGLPQYFNWADKPWDDASVQPDEKTENPQSQLRSGLGAIVANYKMASACRTSFSAFAYVKTAKEQEALNLQLLSQVEQEGYAVVLRCQGFTKDLENRKKPTEISWTNSSQIKNFDIGDFVCNQVQRGYEPSLSFEFQAESSATT